jgi:DNA-binding NarL/FixJ family response regulator
MESQIDVLLATDFPAVRRNVTTLLQAAPDIRLIADVKTGSDALSVAIARNAEVAIVDLNISFDDLHKLITSLFRQDIAVLLMGDAFDQKKTVELLRSGAGGVVPRNIAREMLYKSVRAVAGGQIWVSRQMVTHIVQQLRLLKLIESESVTSQTQRENLQTISPELREHLRLTRREMDVIRAVGQAMTNKEIALRFGITEATVKHHMTKVFDKIGVYSRVELALFAKEFHLIDTTDLDEVQPGVMKQKVAGPNRN